MKLNSDRNLFVFSIFLIGVVFLFGNSFTAWAQSADELQRQIDQLKETVQKLQQRIPKIGYINTQEAFEVFTEAVKEQREEAQKKQDQLLELRNKAAKGEITESTYKKQRDVFQAEIIQSRLAIDLSMLDKMIQSEGFSGIVDQLKELRNQAEPIRKELETSISEIEQGVVSPEQVAETLNRINNQYKQLDQILTNIIEGKIVSVTNQIGKASGYDLVIREENVVLYQDQTIVANLTEEVKRKLQQEIS